MLANMNTGKFFTPAARKAAFDARRRTVDARKTSFGQTEVFAVRRGNALSWELRRFGGVILACGTDSFDSRDDALAAGELARQALMQPA